MRWPTCSTASLRREKQLTNASIQSRRVRFDELATLVSDRVDNPAESGVERYVGLEHLEADSLRIRQWGEITDVESTKLRFRPGDIIFGKRRVYQRKLAVADFEGICSAHAMVLRAKPEAVHPQFLPYFMQSDMFMERALAISVGSLSPTINWRDLAQQQFTLPPIEEQRKIAGLLVAIDAHAESLRDLHGHTGRVRRADLVKFFTDPRLPRKRLDQVAKIIAGSTPSRSRSDYWNGDHLWASAKDLKVRSLASTEDRLTDAGWCEATIAPAGATLIVVRGMILAHTFPVARCLVPTAFNQDLRALVAGEGISDDYLALWAEWMSPWFLANMGESSHGTKRLVGEVIQAAAVPCANRGQQESLIRRQDGLARSVAEIETRMGRASGFRSLVLSRMIGGDQ